MTDLRHIKALELDKVLLRLSELASIKDSKEMALELKPATVLYDAQALINQTNAAYVLLAKFGGPSFGAAKNVNSSLSRAASGGVLTMRELLDVGEVLRVIKGLKSTDRTMIVVTHEMEFARNVADRVIFMADGKIEEEGTPDEVFGAPRSEKTRHFLKQSLENI